MLYLFILIIIADMKIHKSDSRLNDIGIELLRIKLNEPNRTFIDIGRQLGLNKNETNEAKKTAQYHLGIVIKAKASHVTNLYYLQVKNAEINEVTFAKDLPDLYLAPEPEWMQSINLSSLPPTTDAKAILYMNSKF